MGVDCPWVRVVVVTSSGCRCAATAGVAGTVACRGCAVAVLRERYAKAV